MSPSAVRNGQDARGETVRLWPPPEGFWLGLLAAILLYGAHFLYGAFDSRTSLTLDIAGALTLGGILVHRGLRRDLLKFRDLMAPGIAFGLVILVGLWTLTPWVPGGPHPIWAYVNETPALTVDKSSTIVALINLLGLGCLFLVGAASGASDRRARIAIDITLAAGVLFGLWAVIVSATGAEYQAQGRRLEAHFLTANTAATLFGVLFILAFSMALRRLRAAQPRERLVVVLPGATAALLFAVCLVMTASRGGLTATLVALSAMLGIMIFMGQIRASRAMLAILAVAGGLLAVMLAAGDRIIDRLTQAGTDVHIRTQMFTPHWEAFLASPLLGYGLGSYPTVNKTLLTAANFDALGDVNAAHNVYLQWLEQAGIIGAAPMFACIGLILWLTVTGTIRRNRMTSVLFGLLAADVVFLAHGLTDFALETPSMAALWAWLLGLQYALAKGSAAR